MRTFITPVLVLVALSVPSLAQADLSGASARSLGAAAPPPPPVPANLMMLVVALAILAVAGIAASILAGRMKRPPKGSKPSRGRARAARGRGEEEE